MPNAFHFQRLAVAALFLATTLPSWADTRLAPLTLDEALTTAVDRSLQVAVQDAVTLSAREQAVSAAQLPDPVLKLGVDNLPVNGEDRFSLTNDFMTMRRIGVMQELPRFEKRQLRAERFERDAQRAQAERQLAIATVQRSTATTWLDRYYTQAMRELLQRQMEETQLQVQSAQTAFASGRGNQADVFAARAALVMLEDRISQIDRQSRSAGLVLERWVGAAAGRPVAGPPPWQNTSQEGALVREHLAQHPDLLVLAAQVDAAQTDRKLAQANTAADWSVEASYSQRGSAYSNMLSFGVSIPLQLAPQNRQNREVAAKAALVREAQARFDDMLRSHEADVRSLLNDWHNGKERVARFNDQLIPIAQQRTQAAQSGYRAGKGDLASVLAARRDEIDIRLQALGVEQDTARVWAQLHYLTPDTGTPSTRQERQP
nr:TolC family protein [Rhodoferax sp.]